MFIVEEHAIIRLLTLKYLTALAMFIELGAMYDKKSMQRSMMEK
jgi:hypothetical protein